MDRHLLGFFLGVVVRLRLGFLLAAASGRRTFFPVAGARLVRFFFGMGVRSAGVGGQVTAVSRSIDRSLGVQSRLG